MAGKLTTVKVRALNERGRFGDGGGLYLQVQGTGQKSWLFRFMLAGRAREMGLGAVDEVPLAEARNAAQEARKLVRQGQDPIEARRAAKLAEQLAQHQARTFRQVAADYLKAHEVGWRNPKHRYQRRATLDTYAMPVFGDVPVAAVDTGMVMQALEPIWTVKVETATRTRGCVEAVLDYATARGWRTGENPARWRGHVVNLLPRPSRIARVEHHPALPWREIGGFMVDLLAREAVAARALELLILTAARSGEVRGRTWAEVDLHAKLWTVPGERRKADKTHRVSLSPAALAVLEQMKPLSTGPESLVFPTAARTTAGKLPMMSDTAMTVLLRCMGRADLTVHGFHSTFRDWTAEATSYPNEFGRSSTRKPRQQQGGSSVPARRHAGEASRDDADMGRLLRMADGATW